MTIEQIAELSAKIVKAKSDVTSLESQICRLAKSCLNAKFNLEIGHGRYSHTYYLNKEEVALVLNRYLDAARFRLTEAEQEFKEAQICDPEPIVDVSQNIQQTVAVIEAKNIINDNPHTNDL